MCGPALWNEISDRADAVTPPWVYLWCPRYTPTCMDPWLHPCKERPQPMVHLLRHAAPARSEEHTSELQSLMRTSYAVFCLKNKKTLLNNCSQQFDIALTLHT